jgi:hypothetical protein
MYRTPFSGPAYVSDKMRIAQFYAHRLRASLRFPIGIFLVGSVANLRDRPYSDIDIRIYDPGGMNGPRLKHLAYLFAGRMYQETGVRFDVKFRDSRIVGMFPGRVVEL